MVLLAITMNYRYLLTTTLSSVSDPSRPEVRAATALIRPREEKVPDHSRSFCLGILLKSVYFYQYLLAADVSISLYVYVTSFPSPSLAQPLDGLPAFSRGHDCQSSDTIDMVGAIKLVSNLRRSIKLVRKIVSSLLRKDVLSHR